MDDRAKSALEKSIQHWRDNVNAKTPDDVLIGVDYCALCDEFYDAYCEDCPVKARTGQSGCGGSPYDDIDLALLVWEKNLNDVEAESVFKDAAQAELDFLISLRQDVTMTEQWFHTAQSQPTTWEDAERKAAKEEDK